jgi:hypothetical protein
VAAGAAVTTGPVSLSGNGTVAVPLDGYDFRRRIGLLIPSGQESLVDVSDFRTPILSTISDGNRTTS